MSGQTIANDDLGLNNSLSAEATATRAEIRRIYISVIQVRKMKLHSLEYVQYIFIHFGL